MVSNFDMCNEHIMTAMAVRVTWSLPDIAYIRPLLCAAHPYLGIGKRIELRDELANASQCSSGFSRWSFILIAGGFTAPEHTIMLDFSRPGLLSREPTLKTNFLIDRRRVSGDQRGEWHGS